MQVLEAGASESVARCFTTELVREFTVEQIIDPNLAQNAAVAAKVQELVEGCG